MSIFSLFINKLTHPTPFFGLELWITILIFLSLLLFFTLLFLALCFSCRRQKSINLHFPPPSNPVYGASSMDRRLLSRKNWDIEMSGGIYAPEKQVMYSDQWSVQAGEKNLGLLVSGSRRGAQMYMLKEIELATNGLADENVIGSGYHGIVYRGIMLDNERVAVKKLISKSGEDEDFIAQVEAMSRFRHRNLVKLLGCCTEGNYRMLVNEFVDNGNLQQWLHESITEVSPLTWNRRLNIILGTAKGLAYLHEDNEPAIFHQHIKSSNILLDHQWNPKLSDFGLASLLGSYWSPSIAPLLGMSGYTAPEYVETQTLDEKTDAYSFGVLIMEIISGKMPIEQSGTEIEAYLVEWLKSMVSNQNFDQVVDPKLPEMPPLKELKRIVLIALRCVDSGVGNRPSMGDIIHMLEPRDLLLCDTSSCRGTKEKDKLEIKQDDSSHSCSKERKKTLSNKVMMHAEEQDDKLRYA